MERTSIAIRTLLATAVLALTPAPALAQPLFDDPFADAVAYRQDREDLRDASYRLRYEVTREEVGGERVVGEVVIDVATDWSLTRDGDRVWLRDFRLNRIFVLEGDQFTSMNGLVEVTFRVMERQNRTMLQGVLQGLALESESLPNDCDADAELGVALPGAGASRVSLRERRGRVTLRCAGREIGGYEPGDAPAPPAAFWPTLFGEMTTHPALHRHIRESGGPPAVLETSFRVSPEATTRRTWRLRGVEAVATPYPLTEGMRNATAEQLDELVAPGAAQLAMDAVAGRAQGGAPTAESWSAHLGALSLSDEAAAAMLLSPTWNMFPDIDAACSDEPQQVVCQLYRNLPRIAQGDAAPMAAMEVAAAEQRGDSAAAIAAMQRAQTSPNGNHPVLEASFALAVRRFDQAALDQARAAGLPTDVAALQARAVMELPYNPAYWTDIGDRFAAGYRVPDALLLYDVAFSLPMPSAVADNLALAARREALERIRNDFPDASLPR